MKATGWPSASGTEGEHAALSAYQESLRVELISTERAQFSTCGPDELLAVVIDRNRAAVFDFLPVVEPDGAIVGVLGTHAVEKATSQDGIVRDRMEVLGEQHLIGADASILAFIREADSKPFRLVVSGPRISGLVSLSDLQRLPVRAALFAMITHLEMMMATSIRAECAEAEEWLTHLKQTRRDRLASEMESARRHDTLVDPLLFTQFCDKVTILARLLHASGEEERWSSEMKQAQRLRNHVAHSNDYAPTREAARRVCQVVRSMDAWIDRLARGSVTQ